jgi:hypothetical protein
MKTEKNITATVCIITSISAIPNRERKGQIWSYFIRLKSENYCFDMRVPPDHFEKMSELCEVKKGSKVKVLVYKNSVCGIFNSVGLGFMFTNVPFEIA